jgi:hypothetical protein
LHFSATRTYDPVTARWNSPDWIGLAGGDANFYRYVGNGPGNGVDPSGLDWTSFWEDYTRYLFNPSDMDSDLQTAQTASLAVAGSAAAAATVIVVAPAAVIYTGSTIAGDAIGSAAGGLVGSTIQSANQSPQQATQNIIVNTAGGFAAGAVAGALAPNILPDVIETPNPVIVNLGGEGEIPGAINQNIATILKPDWASSASGTPLVQLQEYGNVFVVSSNTNLPFATGSVDVVITNYVPIDTTTFMGPGIQSSQIDSILKPDGIWIHNGQIQF